MIAYNSALLHPRFREKVLKDIGRGEAITAFEAAGMTMREIGFALNCNRRVITSLMLFAAPWYREIEKKFPREYDNDFVPGIDPYRAPQTLRGIAGQRNRVASFLAKEISWWLGQFEVTDMDRQAIIKDTRSRLLWTGLNKHGHYVFSVERAVAEVLGLWKPSGIDPEAREFNLRLSRWLTSWIRFWIVDSRIWKRALELSSAALNKDGDLLAA